MQNFALTTLTGGFNRRFNETWYDENRAYTLIFCKNHTSIGQKVTGVEADSLNVGNNLGLHQNVGQQTGFPQSGQPFNNFYQPSEASKIRIYKLPHPEPKFIGRVNEIKELNEFTRFHSTTRDDEDDDEEIPSLWTRIYRIHGDHGVGKSELVTQVVRQRRNERYFENCVWIQADSRSRIRTEFLELANRLNLPVQYQNKLLDDSDKSIPKLVYDKLCEYKTVIVFDNAQDLGHDGSEGIYDFLPLVNDLPSDKYPLIFVTSQTAPESLWGKASQYLTVEPFSVDECKKFLKEFDIQVNDETDTYWTTIFERVGRIPKALWVIVKKFTEKMSENGTCNPQALIAEMDGGEMNILDFKNPGEISFNEMYEKTLGKLKNGSNPASLRAVHLLNMMSQFEQKDIPVQLIQLMMQDDSEHVPAGFSVEKCDKIAINILIKLSLVKKIGDVYKLEWLLRQHLVTNLKKNQTRYEVFLEQFSKIFAKAFQSTPKPVAVETYYSWISNALCVMRGLENLRHLPGVRSLFLEIALFMKNYDLSSSIESLENLLEFLNTSLSNPMFASKPLFEELNIVVYHLASALRKKDPRRSYSLIIDLEALMKKVTEQSWSWLGRFGNFGKQTQNELDVKLAILKASVLKHLGRYQESRQLYGGISAMKLSFLSAKVLRKIRYKTAIVESKLGNYSAALESFQKIRSEGGPAEHDDISTKIMCDIAETLCLLGRYKGSLEQFQKAEQLYKDQFGANHHLYISLRVKMANTHLLQGEYGKALNIYLQTLETQSTLLGAEHPTVLICQHNIANVMSSMGYPCQALCMLETILEQTSRILGEHHPNSLSVKYSLSCILEEIGQTEEALENYKSIYEIQCSTLGEFHPGTLNTQRKFGAAKEREGDLFEGLTIYNHVLEIRVKVLGDMHPDVLKNMADIGIVCQKLGSLREARRIFSDVYESQVTTIGPTHPDSLDTLHNLANIYRCLGEYAKAQEAISYVKSARSCSLSKLHPDLLSIMNNYSISVEDEKGKSNLDGGRKTSKFGGASGECGVEALKSRSCREPVFLLPETSLQGNIVLRQTNSGSIFGLPLIRYSSVLASIGPPSQSVVDSPSKAIASSSNDQPNTTTLFQKPISVRHGHTVMLDIDGIPHHFTKSYETIKHYEPMIQYQGNIMAKSPNLQNNGLQTDGSLDEKDNPVVVQGSSLSTQIRKDDHTFHTGIDHHLNTGPNSAPSEVTYTKQPYEPFTYNLTRHVITFMGRRDELRELISSITPGSSTDFQFVALTGAGGVGKTETLRLLVQIALELQLFDNILWFDAERRETLLSQFSEATSKLHNSSGMVETLLTNLPLSMLKSMFYGTVCQKRSLIIFDNAESLRGTDKYTSIQEYLPGKLPPSFKRPTFLVSSRNRNCWTGFKIIRLEIFGEKEVKSFVSSHLEEDAADLEIRWMDLVQLLGHRPIALQLAAAYIRFNRKVADCSYSIESLLKEVSGHPVSASKKTVSAKVQAFRSLCSLTFATLLKHAGENGKLAMKILRVASCLSPSEIPGKLLAMLLKPSRTFQRTYASGHSAKSIADTQWDDALKLLQELSLIGIYGKNFTINRQIQTTALYDMSESEKLTLVADIVSTFQNNLLGISRHDPDFVSIINNEIYVRKVVESLPFAQGSEAKAFKERIEVLVEDDRLELKALTDGVYGIGESSLARKYCHQKWLLRTTLHGAHSNSTLRMYHLYAVSLWIDGYYTDARDIWCNICEALETPLHPDTLPCLILQWYEFYCQWERLLQLLRDQRTNWRHLVSTNFGKEDLWSKLSEAMMDSEDGAEEMLHFLRLYPRSLGPGYFHGNLKGSGIMYARFQLYGLQEVAEKVLERIADYTSGLQNLINDGNRTEVQNIVAACETYQQFKSPQMLQHRFSDAFTLSKYLEQSGHSCLVCKTGVFDEGHFLRPLNNLFVTVSSEEGSVM